MTPVAPVTNTFTRAAPSWRERNSASDSEVRVPAGATLFDAASWNGIAVDSTCGGHGRRKIDLPCDSVELRISVEKIKRRWESD